MDDGQKLGSLFNNRLPSTPSCQEKWREDHFTRSIWLPIGDPECLERCVLERSIWVLDCIELCVLTIWNSRKGSKDMICQATFWLYFRKALSEIIIESLRFLKCVLYFISFLNIPLGFMIPGIYSNWKYFDWWRFLTIFYLRFMCLITFDFTDAAHWTADLLSLFIGIPMSLAQCFRDCSSVVHSLVVTILYS